MTILRLENEAEDLLHYLKDSGIEPGLTGEIVCNNGELVTVGTNGITSITCAGTGSCVCTTALTIDIVNATGTWATSGTMLTFAGAPGGDGPYCVQGSTLHLVALDRATMTKVINDIVLTKP